MRARGQLYEVFIQVCWWNNCRECNYPLYFKPGLEKPCKVFRLIIEGRYVFASYRDHRWLFLSWRAFFKLKSSQVAQHLRCTYRISYRTNKAASGLYQPAEKFGEGIYLELAI